MSGRRRKEWDGITLGPDSPAATLDVRKPERVEARDADAFILGLGGEVVEFSQARATQQTEGIPDRRYRVLGVAFWYELKREGEKLTKTQYDFLCAELDCRAYAACGTADELMALVRVIVELRGKPELLRLHMAERVTAYGKRGFRREPPRRSGRPRGARRGVR